MTAETEARQEEIETHNASACPVVEAIDQVGTPWRLNVVYALQDGEQRFNELKRATDARSKTLSDALDALAAADIVDRRMEADAPVAVYYSLTEKGTELSAVLAELGAWAQRWGEDVPNGFDRQRRGP
ncbi:winged helix-turn-helix transcriptional regulator [Halorientalis pallida]|uniref:winged helix-turn-helix transcriptional regulator n=1 Tax=Halorientalis pallida TaxID=2479928 RepID=UPI003C6EFE01